MCSIGTFFLGGCAIYFCNMLTRIVRYLLPVPVRVQNIMQKSCPCQFGHTLCVPLIAWPFIGLQPITVRQSHDI